jgi:hypothetical protein
VNKQDAAYRDPVRDRADLERLRRLHAVIGKCPRDGTAGEGGTLVHAVGADDESCERLISEVSSGGFTAHWAGTSICALCGLERRYRRSGKQVPASVGRLPRRARTITKSRSSSAS